MTEHGDRANKHGAVQSPCLQGGGQVVSLAERRLLALQESVEKTRGKLKKLELRLIRGELKKGKLRRKLLKRTRALSELEHRLGEQGVPARRSLSDSIR
jgi:hypothetical protein